MQSGVQHILYPSMWFSDLPFLTCKKKTLKFHILFVLRYFANVFFFKATQIQQSWAYDNNVNLLSAVASNPNVG